MSELKEELSLVLTLLEYNKQATTTITRLLSGFIFVLAMLFGFFMFLSTQTTTQEFTVNKVSADDMTQRQNQ